MTEKYQEHLWRGRTGKTGQKSISLGHLSHWNTMSLLFYSFKISYWNNGKNHSPQSLTACHRYKFWSRHHRIGICQDACVKHRIGVWHLKNTSRNYMTQSVTCCICMSQHAFLFFKNKHVELEGASFPVWMPDQFHTLFLNVVNPVDFTSADLPKCDSAEWIY